MVVVSSLPLVTRKCNNNEIAIVSPRKHKAPVHIASTLDSLMDTLSSEVMASLEGFHIHCTFRDVDSTQHLPLLIDRAKRKIMFSCSIWCNGTLYIVKPDSNQGHYTTDNAV